MDRMTEICIARHGETDWNAAGVLQGWLDVPLNDTGRQQAHDMAFDLRHERFDGVFSSPLQRAREHAEIVARYLNLPPPQQHAGIKERHFGVIQGIPKAELAELNPVLCQQILRRNPAAEFEQGESMDEFADRIFAGLHEIAAANVGRRLLVITHGWVLDVITRHVRGVPRNTILAMKRRNGECLWLGVNASRIIAVRHDPAGGVAAPVLKTAPPSAP